MFKNKYKEQFLDFLILFDNCIDLWYNYDKKWTIHFLSYIAIIFLPKMTINVTVKEKEKRSNGTLLSFPHKIQNDGCQNQRVLFHVQFI